MPYGRPLTEEERRAKHMFIYGEEPPKERRRRNQRIIKRFYETEDDYWWDSKRQELVIKGYDLPPNPEEGGEPIWGIRELAKAHPQEVRRLFWQCYWQAMGKYRGFHKPLSEQACKLIEMTCYGEGICKRGGGLYREIFGVEHPIKEIEVKGLKKR